jgi:NADH:ubiquinone oxidoreductase subunit
MGFFKNLFTWWDGATLGTALFSWKNGRKVGEDPLGNRYFETKKAGGRRWVMYAGSNDVSRVPPEWYAWLTRQIDAVPDEALPPPPKFLRAATPNLTGTPEAYRPTGALEKGGRRQAASGDYQAWTPD